MAYFNTQDEEQDQPILESADGGGIANDNSPTPGTAQKSNNSGTFTNLSDFLTRNRDQAIDMGNKIGGYIGNQTKEAQDIINNSSQQFSDQVSKGTINYDANAVEAAAADPIANGVGVKDILGGKYKGPEDFRQTELFNPYAKEVGDVSTITENYKTAGGRDQILGNVYKNDNGKAYDRFLVEKTQPAYKSINDAINAANPIVAGASTKLGDLDTQVANAKNTSQTSADQARARLQSEADKVKAEVDQAVNDKITTDTQLQTQIKDAIAVGDFTKLSQLGVTPDVIKKIQDSKNSASIFDENVNEANYLTLRDPNAVNNAGNVATDVQRNKYQGLNDLLGGTSSVLNKTDVGQSTVFDANGLANNYDKLVTDGLIADEAKRQVARGNFATVEEAQASIRKQSESANTRDYISTGISTGASIGSVIPGVGTAIGAVVGGVLGAAIGLLSKSNDTQGTKDYKAYQKSNPNISGRDFSPEQISGITYNLMKKNGSDPIVADFGKAFGLNDPKSQFETVFNRIANQAIQEAQTKGLLPTDAKKLAAIDGERIFRKIIAPKIDETIGMQNGVKGYNLWSSNNGEISQISADLTDQITSGANADNPATRAPYIDTDNNTPYYYV